MPYSFSRFLEATKMKSPTVNDEPVSPRSSTFPGGFAQVMTPEPYTISTDGSFPPPLPRRFSPGRRNAIVDDPTGGVVDEMEGSEVEIHTLFHRGRRNAVSGLEPFWNPAFTFGNASRSQEEAVVDEENEDGYEGDDEASSSGSADDNSAPSTLQLPERPVEQPRRVILWRRPQVQPHPLTSAHQSSIAPSEVNIEASNTGYHGQTTPAAPLQPTQRTPTDNEQMADFLRQLSEMASPTTSRGHGPTRAPTRQQQPFRVRRRPVANRPPPSSISAGEGRFLNFVPHRLSSIDEMIATPAVDQSSRQQQGDGGSARCVPDAPALIQTEWQAVNGIEDSERRVNWASTWSDSFGEEPSRTYTLGNPLTQHPVHPLPDVGLGLGVTGVDPNPEDDIARTSDNDSHDNISSTELQTPMPTAAQQQTLSRRKEKRTLLFTRPILSHRTESHRDEAPQSLLEIDLQRRLEYGTPPDSPPTGTDHYPSITFDMITLGSPTFSAAGRGSRFRNRVVQMAAVAVRGGRKTVGAIKEMSSKRSSRLSMCCRGCDLPVAENENPSKSEGGWCVVVWSTGKRSS